jgi:hypothetical protein
MPEELRPTHVRWLFVDTAAVVVHKGTRSCLNPIPPRAGLRVLPAPTAHGFRHVIKGDPDLAESHSTNTDPKDVERKRY